MALEISADIPAHDASLVGDQLTTLVVNFRWRRILTPLIQSLCSDNFWTGTQAEIEDATYKAINLLFDLYDIDPMQKIAARLRPTGGFTALLASTLTEVEWADPALNPRDYDFGGFYDAANPTVLTIPAGLGGIYSFFANVFYTVTGSALNVFTSLDWNNMETIAQSRDDKDDLFGISIAGDFEVSAGDEIRLKLFSSLADTVVVHFELHRVFK